jgi:hypothetical protein
VWFLSFTGCLLFAAYVLPLLPPLNWTESWNPPDVRIATPWYFLPKSIEILFQQLLVVALVLTLSAQQYSLRQISIYCALLFGAMHILLVFGGVPLGYVIRFMVSATAFGFVFSLSSAPSAEWVGVLVHDSLALLRGKRAHAPHLLVTGQVSLSWWTTASQPAISAH